MHMNYVFLAELFEHLYFAHCCLFDDLIVVGLFELLDRD